MDSELSRSDAFRVAGGSGVLWSLRGFELMLAADTLWKAFERARQIAAEVSSDDVNVPPLRGLHPEELEDFEKESLERPALFLLGLAIEVQAKTVLVEADPEGATKDGAFVHASHDLPTLLERAGFSLTPDERKEVALLSDIVKWYGRYPVAAQEKGLASQVPLWSLRAHGLENTWAVGRAVLARTRSIPASHARCLARS